MTGGSFDYAAHIDRVFEQLGFQRDIAWKLQLGSTEIIGGLSPFGFSIMFTEIGPRSATQYEEHAPLRSSRESVAELIRGNLQQNFRDALPLWDHLQSKPEDERRLG